MKLEFYPEDKLKRELLTIMKRHIDLKRYKVFFFGSRIIGKSHNRSDIDVGIEGHKRISPESWFNILDEVENVPTLYKIDLVDFSQVSDNFRKLAKQHIEMLS